MNPDPDFWPIRKKKSDPDTEKTRIRSTGLISVRLLQFIIHQRPSSIVCLTVPAVGTVGLCLSVCHLSVFYLFIFYLYTSVFYLDIF